MSDVDPIEAVERALERCYARHDQALVAEYDQLRAARAALPALVAMREERDALRAQRDEARAFAALRAAAQKLYTLALSRCHWSDGSCEHDDVGTMASGMGAKPCSVHFHGKEQWWCYACKLEATGMRAVLAEGGLV